MKQQWVLSHRQFNLKLGNVKAVMRTLERTGVLNPRLPVGDGMNLVALEPWHGSLDTSAALV